MRSRLLLAAVLALAPALVDAGVLRNDVLMVNGRPFYPLSSWTSHYTTPAEIARLGMNTCYWGCYDPSPKALAGVRKRMRDCWAHGLQFVAYVTPGPVATGWSDAQTHAYATLAREPNLLAWYVGDDITAPQLKAMEATVNGLRKYAPSVPGVADFIGEDSPEARETYRRYIDIRSCYDYPVPGQPIREYMKLFDKYRAFAGDPMWTWIQNFMWGSTALRYNLGAEGGGPIPDPEQVRLMAHAAINRGVRGLLFFSHNQLHRLPEVSAEVALTCREVALFNDQLAAGKLTMNLPASDPDVNVAAFRYGASTVLSAMLIRPQYHRWIDEGVVRNLTITCAWPRGPLPQALQVATPDVVPCRVARVPGSDRVRITIPSLELCGFVLLTRDAGQAARLRKGVAAAARSLAALAPGAATAQTRKVAGAVWQAAMTEGDPADETLVAARLADACGDAAASGRPERAVRHWRRALRTSRRVIAGLMGAVEARRGNVPANLRYFLESPYALHNIPGIGLVPTSSDPWRYIPRWAVTGPFALESTGKATDPPPTGFLRAYPPESDAFAPGPFASVDGPARWSDAEALVSGMLNLRPLFATTDDVVAYARATVVAPRDMEVTMGIGSNDACRIWLNGEQVFSWWGGRGARQNEDKVPVKLRKGPNTVLAKVANLGNSWQLFVSFTDPARELTFGIE